ncbi:MAG: lipid A deacylase LpxR family protein [Desulfoarculaceae bacterium]|nr:lipid A deacylase LpxR family protein [Desulfoarculaceae bacterium]
MLLDSYDGNTFTDSHEIDKEYFVADLMAGVSVHCDRFKITYSHAYRTEEFETQQDA